MMKRHLSAVIAIALISPALKAQSLQLGPQLSFHKSADADKGNVMVGAALRCRLSEALGIEGSINYRKDELAASAGNIRSWPIMATGLLYPIPAIYGALGMGWYNSTFDFDSEAIENETSRDFGWHFGGGLALPVDSNVKFSGDIRYVFLDYSFDALPFEDVDSNFYVITAGLFFDL